MRNCGIVRREHTDRLQEAWTLYRDRLEKPSGVASTLFRRSYAHETEIRFIGVWDTVGALGVPVPDARWLQPVVNRFNRRWGFHDTELSSWVKAAFQALAIDEQRSAFTPTLWHRQPGVDERSQELKQVWFSGVHCDVGGGYKQTGLSDLALLWIVEQAGRCGLEFDMEVLSESGPREMKPDECIDFRVRPNALGTLHDSRTALWRLAKPLHRPIGCAGRGANERVAIPAKTRYDTDSSYRPRELTGYFADQQHAQLEPVPLSGSDLRQWEEGGKRWPEQETATSR